MSDIMANSKPEGVQLIVVKLSFGLGGVKLAIDVNNP